VSEGIVSGYGYELRLMLVSLWWRIEEEKKKRSLNPAIARSSKKRVIGKIARAITSPRCCWISKSPDPDPTMAV